MSNMYDSENSPFGFKREHWRMIHDSTNRGIFIGKIPFFLKYYPKLQKWKFCYKFKTNRKDYHCKVTDEIEVLVEQFKEAVISSKYSFLDAHTFKKLDENKLWKLLIDTNIVKINRKKNIDKIKKGGRN